LVYNPSIPRHQKKETGMTPKFVILAALVAFVATPVMASTLTKGSKSYQSSQTASKSDDQPAQTTEAANSQNGDVTKIEPAAGTPAAEPKQDSGKTFQEEMRLPRKD